MSELVGTPEDRFSRVAAQMRKRHFIQNNNVKMSKTIKNEECDVNVETKMKMRNIENAW